MTQEQKAEAYDEAIERASKLRVQNPFDTVSQMMEYVFPELKESEDALTWLTRYIEEEAYSLSMDIRDNEDRTKLEKLKKSLAWLEKQGEQKPTDKVEPKFHEGDWVIDKQGIVHQVANVVENVTNHTYGYDIVGGGYFNDNNEGVRLWSIEDAKDGDVLVTVDDKCPFIYKGCLDPKHPNSPVAYCGIDTEDFFSIGGDKFNHWWTDMEVQPATKEQRDLLFQRMKEAEYEWDEVKKELKKIEQKSTWSEDDEDAIGQAIVALEDMFDEDHPRNCYAGYKLSFIDAAERLKSLKDRIQPQNTWKPSDEQILALRWILNNIPYDRHKEEISGLLEQINKLKGE